MRFKLFLTFGISIVLLYTVADAQDGGIFGGQGIPGPESKKTDATSKWPKLLDFSKDEPKPRSSNPFSGMFTKKPSVEKPSFDLFKSKKMEPAGSSDKASPFAGLSDLFPKRDPDKPNIFKQMNAKSKGFFERSNHWTQRRNQTLKDKSYGTWDQITRDMREIQARQKATKPAQPPIRTAETTDQPRVRF
jgi:hypothetical protein